MTTATATATTTRTVTAAPSCHSLSRSSSTASASAKPSWLLAALAELEEKYQSLTGSHQSEKDEPDSFAVRAENYYRKRPQLLSLVHDLYHRYISLADRYTQAYLKPHKLHRRSPSQISTVLSDIDDADSGYPDSDPVDSDAESSLSFQGPPLPHPELPPPSLDVDSLVAELVSRSVENELLHHEIVLLDKHQSEATQKIDLQSSLLEVLESERMVLLTENARLGSRAAAMAEENEGLAAEVGYMRRTAEELARCVMKLREDHRVCLLGRKMQELQAQIYGLEKRNRECYEVMAQREEEKADLVRGVCLELEKVKADNKRLREVAAAARRKSSKKWWGGVRSLNWALCGSHVKTEM